MTFSRSQLVTIAPPGGDPLPDGASIRYTLDGTPPSDLSALYVDPFLVDRTSTVKAIITGGGLETSDPATFPIVIRVAAPTISPSGGSFTEPVIISMECATPNAEIRYTIDGALPDESSALYSGAFLLDASHTIQARAFLSPKDPSTNTTATIVIAATSSVFFGYSPLTILNESQLDAMSNAPEASNSVTKTDFFGTYVIGSGASVSDYTYFWCPATFSHPRATDGFNIPASGVFGNIPMAGPADGYTDGPVNGFYHKAVTKDGVAGREYRTFNQLGDSLHAITILIQ